MGTIGYGYGSEWQLLQYLGRRRNALTSAVQNATGVSGLHWLDGQEDVEGGVLKLREHKGLRFLPADDQARTDWEAIWPQSGNAHNWDAVGLGQAGGSQSWVLVEAKAHLGELNSSCAASAASRLAIKGILDRTRQALKVTSGGEWTEAYYQAANRIALLHFLLERGLDVHLVFLYFTGDRMELGAEGRVCPRDEAGWRPALDAQNEHLGVPLDAAIWQRMHSLFLPAVHVRVGNA